MATIRTTAHTPIEPGAFVGALTDFSQRRLSIFTSISPRYYAVHALGDTWAEVTEGADFGGGIWERLRYDWSQPGVIHLAVLDSNTFRPGSYWEYRVDAAPGGGSIIYLTLSRKGKTVKGYVLSALMGVFGKKVLADSLRKTLVSLEGESGSGTAGQPHPAKQQTRGSART